MILLGENSEKITAAIQNTKISKASSMQNVIQIALEDNEQLVNSNEQRVVLLSPSASSYDMFKSFEEKGDAFKACISSHSPLSP